MAWSCIIIVCEKVLLQAKVSGKGAIFIVASLRSYSNTLAYHKISVISSITLKAVINVGTALAQGR